MRSPLTTLFICAAGSAVVLSVAACSGGDIAVGKTNQTEQELKKRTDGGPTGNGQTCSWEGTVGYDVATGTTTTTPGAGPFSLGQDFKSLDGCNDCTCSAQGIMCTLRACNPGGGGTSPGNPGNGPACSLEAKICPDGSSVGRGGPNCEFSPCPGTGGNACTDDARQCPDGSWVGRSGPNCEFVCPPGNIACPADAKLCPDGSYVARTGPKCEFAPCP